MRVRHAVSAALLLAGCVREPLPPPPLPSVTGPLRIAVLPFRVAGSPDAGAVAPDAGAEPARLLGTHLAALGLTVVDADRVAGTAALAEAGAYDARFASRVADKVGATLGVLGTLSRYREREGTAWAVQSPASVAYEVALVRASDGTVVAVDRFEHTQQALADNVFELPRFVRGGGRWLTREEMLDQALARTAERLARAIVVAPAR